MEKYKIILKCSGETEVDIKRAKKMKKKQDKIFNQFFKLKKEGLFTLHHFYLEQDGDSIFNDYVIKVDKLTFKIRDRIINYITEVSKEIISLENKIKITLKIIEKPYSIEKEILKLKF